MFEFLMGGAPKNKPTPEPSQTAEKHEQAPKVKPCCVCKDEKASRDECMLMAPSPDVAESNCQSTIDAYRSCMAGFGFKV